MKCVFAWGMEVDVCVCVHIQVVFGFVCDTLWWHCGLYWVRVWGQGCQPIICFCALRYSHFPPCSIHFIAWGGGGRGGGRRGLQFEPMIPCTVSRLKDEVILVDEVHVCVCGGDVSGSAECQRAFQRLFAWWERQDRGSRRRSQVKDEGIRCEIYKNSLHQRWLYTFFLGNHLFGFAAVLFWWDFYLEAFSFISFVSYFPPFVVKLEPVIWSQWCNNEAATAKCCWQNWWSH